LTFGQASPYYIDFPGRIKARCRSPRWRRKKIDRVPGLAPAHHESWTTDAFLPLAQLHRHPRRGAADSVFTFVIDAARAADDSWLDEDHVLGFAPMGGQDQIIADLRPDQTNYLPHGGRVGVEAGMSNYLPEGYLTSLRISTRLKDALPGCDACQRARNRRPPADDQGASALINRFREASRIVDIGHEAVLARAQKRRLEGHDGDGDSGPRGPRHAQGGQHVWEWSFTGGNEIACGLSHRVGGRRLHAGEQQERVEAGEPLMVDIHALFGLACGDHSHNYLIAPATRTTAVARKEFR
jgi:hypothetical protein